MNDFILKACQIAARSQHIAVTITRLGLILVLVWIGGLKVYKYEAEGIVPFVANSPFMNFFLHFSAPDYKKHVNPEGAVVASNQAWHQENHTYNFSYGLGAVIVFYGLLLCLHPWKPELAALGSFLVIIMSFVTLSFLITTRECWVPDLGGPEHGFPLLSGRGRLVVKDAIMLGAAMVTMADSASAYLRKRSSSTSKATTQSHLASNRRSVDVS